VHKGVTCKVANLANEGNVLQDQRETGETSSHRVTCTHAWAVNSVLSSYEDSLNLRLRFNIVDK
jgi:hypothetical protein